jgi:microcystin degradation protein MlrC
MRVAIGGFTHETNTFNPVPTTMERIKTTGQYLEGAEMVERSRGINSVLGGFVDGGEAHGLEIVPTFFAGHGPQTGLIDRAVVDHVTERLVRGFADARADGVLLHLHGASAADGLSDPEAHILRAVRQAIGRGTPLVLVYDLHANAGPDWVDHPDAIVGYKTAPHVDMAERGREGAALMRRMLDGAVKPVVRMAKPPILVKSGLMSMTDAPLALIKPPMYWLMQRAREMERLPRVLNVSVAAGFGDADVPEAGMTMFATTDGDPELAQRLVDELAETAWRLRRGFMTDLVLMPPALAVARAVASPEWPVILSDQGNNTAGGSPGDGTAILAELKKNGWPDAALFVADEEAARAACQAGVGAPFKMAVGARLDRTSGEPVELDGTVRVVTDGVVALGPGRVPPRLGRTAVVRCGRTDVVLTERPSSQDNAGFFRAVGIEPRDRRITVVQSAHRFRDQFEVKEHIPKVIFDVDSPGFSNPDVRRFAYRNVRRPIFPLDEMPDGAYPAR